MKKKPIYDVFLSCSVQDLRFVSPIERALREVGLTVFSSGAIVGGSNIIAALWEAASECRAFVLVLSTTWKQSQHMAFELGAVSAWNKPTYILLRGMTRRGVPPFLRHFPILPILRYEAVVRRIAGASPTLSTEDVERLRMLYLKTGIAVDQLALRPAELAQLTASFNRKSRMNWSTEHLLSELLRLRKGGVLPRTRVNKPR
jgi:hypothetical protein